MYTNLLCNNNNNLYPEFLSFILCLFSFVMHFNVMSEEKSDITSVPRSLQLWGLNLLTYKLQLGKQLSLLVGMQKGILYSGRSASTNAI